MIWRFVSFSLPNRDAWEEYERDGLILTDTMVAHVVAADMEEFAAN